VFNHDPRTYVCIAFLSAACFSDLDPHMLAQEPRPIALGPTYIGDTRHRRTLRRCSPQPLYQARTEGGARLKLTVASPKSEELPWEMTTMSRRHPELFPSAYEDAPVSSRECCRQKLANGAVNLWCCCKGSQTMLSTVVGVPTHCPHAQSTSREDGDFFWFRAAFSFFFGVER
jgi:hypothetical protein